MPGERIQPLLELARGVQTALAASRSSQRDCAAAAQWVRRIGESDVKAGQPAPRKPPPDVFAASPADPKLRRAYTDHVMSCVREFVDFSQSSEYLQCAP